MCFETGWPIPSETCAVYISTKMSLHSGQRVKQCKHMTKQRKLSFPMLSSFLLHLFPSLFSFGCLSFRKEKRWVASVQTSVQLRAWICGWMSTYDHLSERVCIFGGIFCVCLCVCAGLVLCWLWLCWLRTRYQVTLVIVECVDKNNETFANRDSVGPLKGLRRGLTLPEDIAADRGGRWAREWKAKKRHRDRARARVSPIFFFAVLIPKKTCYK